MQVFNFTIEDHERKRAKAQRAKDILKHIPKGQEDNVVKLPVKNSVDSTRKVG